MSGILTADDLARLTQQAWSEWANGKDGFGPPVERALREAVRLVGGIVEKEVDTVE